MSPLRTDAPKLYLNEHLSPRLAIRLREYGFDVISSQEANLLSEPDDEQMRFAAREQRAIVTFNFRDFATLHEWYAHEQIEHWGIIFSTEEPLGILFHRIVRLLNAVPKEELKNAIRWLNEFK